MSRPMGTENITAGPGPAGVPQGVMGAVMNDQLIGTDLLISAKTGVRNLAYAITETDTPEVRRTLQQHLNQAIEFHERVFGYMTSKGYYNPHNIQEQIRIDQQGVQQVMQMRM